MGALTFKGKRYPFKLSGLSLGAHAGRLENERQG
jgi:hypothetical protein